MKESEYIKAENMTKVSMALAILKDVLPGDDYGISANELSQLIPPLARLKKELFASYELEED